MIEIDGLTVELSGRTILQNCSLHVKENEKLAISGASGAGKSTLLKTLIGRHRPEKGKIVIDGTPLIAPNLNMIRSRLFYLPQSIQPLGDETGRDFLSMPFSLSVSRGRLFDKVRAETLFDTFGLKRHLMDSRLLEMSGGERKRLGLIQALLLDRPILLLDELTSSVDERNSEALVDAVLGLTDTTVVAITHDGALMERAERHVVLHNGHIEPGVGGADGRG